MQQFEWARFKADYGLTGKDGKIPFPVCEMHGNHDGPQGDTFLIDEILLRNRTRPGVTNFSDNGLHCSWEWGPLHNVALGIFVGKGETRRDDHHYAPRASLEFLRRDLAEKVGDSGRPVILYYHIHPNTGDYDWPQEDLDAFWETIEPYNVIAMFHGHTHGSPPSRMQWDGVKFANNLENGIDIFNPDDVTAAKVDPRDPEKGLGFLHGFLYVELIDNEGEDKDNLVVRSYATRDNWATHDWNTTWTSAVTIPASVKPTSSVLAKRQILESHDWWDNRDFNWYENQIPFLETPNEEIDTTWYYRWDLLTIMWDKNGNRYILGKGLHLLVDGQRVGGADTLEPAFVERAVPLKRTGRTSAADREATVATNFAVNNDGTYFPRMTASNTEQNTSVAKLNDGNYWYLLHPPNRWSCQNSPNTEDWIAVDFGTPRTIHTVKLYVLDDSNLPNSPISVPQSLRLEAWTDDGWNQVDFKAASAEILGHRPHVLTFAALTTQKLRATLVHGASGRFGLTELEAWGDIPLPLDSLPHPPGNLAYNDGSSEFPKATASHHDRFGVQRSIRYEFEIWKDGKW